MIGLHLSALIGFGAAMFFLLIIKETQVFQLIIYKCRTEKQPPPLENPDDDVLTEMNRIRKMNPVVIKAQNLVMRDLSKYYKRFLAVNQLCVSVEP